MSHTISITEKSIKLQNSIAFKIVMSSQEERKKKKKEVWHSELKKRIKYSSSRSEFKAVLCDIKTCILLHDNHTQRFVHS